MSSMDALCLNKKNTTNFWFILQEMRRYDKMIHDAKVCCQLYNFLPIILQEKLDVHTQISALLDLGEIYRSKKYYSEGYQHFTTAKNIVEGIFAFQYETQRTIFMTLFCLFLQ